MQRMVALAALGLLIALSVQSPLKAQTVTQGYNSDQSLQRGMIVTIKKDDGTKVELASQKNIDQLHGIVVNNNDAPVTLSSGTSQVYVATTGKFKVFVSNQSGTINAGDYITISALDGIGMRAGTKEKVVIGRALESFDGKASSLSQTKVKDSAGTEVAVSIGRIDVDLKVSSNPLYRQPSANIPEFLQNASEAIAGKPVNPVRVYIGVGIFLISTLVALSLMYGGVRSAIISVGRNPLSKKSIIRSMTQVIIVGMTIFISGIFGVYLLLRI